MDSQSVKNTDTASPKSYDGCKKISGIKRHIGVDTLGLPVAVFVTTANVSDRDGALLALQNSGQNMPLVQKIMGDSAYAGEIFQKGVEALLGAAVEVVKRSEAHIFVVLPKRWIVERSFSWLEKCRRLWKNCERLISTSLQMIHFAFLALILRRL